MIYYTVYKVTNTLNGKFYIGTHKTGNLNDGYMGSGKYLKNAQKKYGIENFQKKILFIFETSQEMYIKEAEIVNAEFITNKDSYNLKIGGSGGFDHINNDESFRKAKNQKAYNTMIRALYEQYQDESPFIAIGKMGYKKKREMYPNLSKEIAIRGHEEGWFTFKGNHHTQDAKNKIASANKIHQSGEGNSQYGTVWIYSAVEKRSKKIKKNEPIPDGWILGRTMKRAKP